MRVRDVFLLLVLLPFASCSRAPGVFSEPSARAHVGMLAGTIGSRPVGTPANARARAYVVDQLKQIGFQVRVQEADGRRADIGRTARVSNIIAILPGTRREAIGLLSHYDSTPDAPGAADDALGVAVSLEAARVLAAREGRNWSLFVIVTDGEEAGLMGAAALMADREVTERLRAYVNIEAAGSSGPAILFETGPGNGWLVSPWARTAPHPRGGSYAVEVYRRLPNDTDFSIIKRHDIPGLNFAPVGDSYAYHTARDTPERLSSLTIRETGENAVAIAGALEQVDITTRTAAEATFFDIGRTVAIRYGPAASWAVAAAALLLGVIAWVKVTAAALRLGGVGRWLLTALWSLLGLAAAAGAMVVAAWGLRAAREVYHPWYAHPDRLFLLMAVAGATAAWSVGRIGQWLPARTHGVRHPVLTWSFTLPVWMALASAMLWLAPAAAYLWMVPLLVAGFLLVLVPPANALAVRTVSIVVLGVSGTLWLRETVELMRFVVAIFGRLPAITPALVYPALMVTGALMIVPPLIAAVTATQPLRRPAAVTTLCLLALVASAALAYVAPAYTPERPLRRYLRALQEADGRTAVWEVASVEPGLDLDSGAPEGFTVAGAAPSASVPWGRLPYPFVFRNTAQSLGPAPIAVAGFTIQPVADGIEMRVTAVPSEPGLALAFVLPEDIVPARTSLPGIRRLGRWRATYIAPPPDGIVWQASFRGVTTDRLRDTKIAVTSFGFPGGAGWQRLPGWLPQTTTVWSATATWIVPAASGPTLEPVPPLR
ncbi:MAG: M20/M25/M40 family metallo-hydrolase [Acidobacteria bacterium]|nr:M20/M25/M40 family metallo-hydrolase [Acidobacteriota bacterium]